MSLFNQHGWSKPKSPEYVDTNPEQGKRAKHVFSRHEGLGREYTRNGHTAHIGSFAVDSFKPSDATDPLTGPANEYILTAGCHRILWSEILDLSPAFLAADAQGTANLNPFGAGTPES